MIIDEKYINVSTYQTKKSNSSFYQKIHSGELSKVFSVCIDCRKIGVDRIRKKEKR